MALSTVKIADTAEWSKRFMFDRNPVIGNSLEPALTSANIVKQTILGPPFSWWWNNEELTFTCNPVAQTVSVTNIVITAGVLTVTITSTTPLPVGALVLSNNIATATQLNGESFIVATSSATQFTANTTLPDYGTAADTGTFTAQTTQDYMIPVPEFSHIEHCSVLDISQTPPKWSQMEVKNNLALDSTQDRPRFLNPHVEDGNGNMTFRVMPAPDQSYPVSIHIQKASSQITSMNQTWAPIPDYMQYVYNWGFLALMWNFSDDSRFGMANQKFLAGLMARAEGIGEEERNAFLNAWNGLTGHEQAMQQQGMQARGV